MSPPGLGRCGWSAVDVAWRPGRKRQESPSAESATHARSVCSGASASQPEVPASLPSTPMYRVAHVSSDSPPIFGRPRTRAEAGRPRGSIAASETAPVLYSVAVSLSAAVCWLKLRAQSTPSSSAAIKAVAMAQPKGPHAKKFGPNKEASTKSAAQPARCGLTPRLTLLRTLKLCFFE